jgi:hypothetical protein
VGVVLNCVCLLLLGSLIATWRERGCNSFWKVVRQFPFLRSHIVGWKACFVIHRVFRDGHPDVRNSTYLLQICSLGGSFVHCDPSEIGIHMTL